MLWTVHLIWHNFYLKEDLMDKQNKIPTSKVERAGRFLKASVKVGGNYAAHYVKKAFKETDDDELDRKNAEEIFKVLSQLKGSALKIAQMLSMDSGILPRAYAEKFAAAQNSAMALSGPLVMNTFRKYTGKAPQDIFDTFNPDAKHAASIGQVHEAWKNGQRLAVKIQYPGVADSIHSDIQMVKPFVTRFLGVSPGAVEEYVAEIEERLVEETDYVKELSNGQQAFKAMEFNENIIVPNYYPEYSNERILTMDWLEGITLNEFINSETDQEKKNYIGQLLMDFIHEQIHTYKRFHADLHPGNFLVTKDLKLCVLDFGCMKSLPDDFYNDYFSLVKDDVRNNEEKLREVLYRLDMLRKQDTPEEDQLFFETTIKSIDIISAPLKSDVFDFGSEDFFNALQEHGDSIYKNKAFRNSNAMRGSKHGIYLHRAFYGLFAILHNMNASIQIRHDFADNIQV